jgi:hypothetical protein
LLLLSVNVTAALQAPAAVGVNVRLTMQPDPGVTVPFTTHVVPLDATAKSAAFAPEIATEEIVRAAFPVFDTVIGCAPLVWPTI